MNATTRKSDTELEEKYKLLLSEPLSVRSVQSVNFKPHPFTIGTRHVVDASDNHCGILGEATLKKIPCAFKSHHAGSCNLPYESHTSDRVLFLQLTRNTTEEEVRRQITKEFGEIMASDGLDGLTFVQSGFKIGEKPL